jgi:hypothetical protein
MPIFLGSDSLPLQKHGISVTEKAVSLRHGMAVKLQDVGMSRKGRHQHHESAFGQVNIG